MKARFLFLAVALFLSSVLSSCLHQHDDISISIQEDEEEYRLSARYDDSKTGAVENYIKTCTASNGRFNYSGHGDINATVTLDDKSRVYIRSREGRLKIKFNKEENTEEAYERIRDMCEGIKDLLAEN